LSSFFVDNMKNLSSSVLNWIVPTKRKPNVHLSTK
jgi:hypothetical protein